LRIIDELLRHCEVDLIHGGLDAGAPMARHGFRSLRLPPLLHDEQTGDFFDPETSRGIDEIWAERARAITGFLRMPYQAIVVETLQTRNHGHVRRGA
jgi:hypothetical protein